MFGYSNRDTPTKQATGAPLPGTSTSRLKKRTKSNRNTAKCIPKSPKMIHPILSIIIGRLLYLLIATYSLLQQLWHRLHALARRSYDYWKCDYHHHELFERTKHELQKLPQHLVLVVAPDDRYVDATLLKRIFSYAQIVGIPHLSVYDTRTPINGYVDLSRFCKSTGNDNRSYLWSTPQSIKENEQKVKLNGLKTPILNGNGAHYAQLQVYQISSADGHALIADVCRELYEKRQTPQVQELLEKRQKLSDGINGMLNKRLGFVAPEPELGIIFSRLTCIYGLLPWHVRFTEFYTHHSGCHFDAETFANVLYKYARCEQRWGK